MKNPKSQTLNTDIYGELAPAAEALLREWKAMSRMDKATFTREFSIKYQCASSTLQKKLCGQYKFRPMEIILLQTELRARGHNV